MRTFKFYSVSEFHVYKYNIINYNHHVLQDLFILLLEVVPFQLHILEGASVCFHVCARVSWRNYGA